MVICVEFSSCELHGLKWLIRITSRRKTWHDLQPRPSATLMHCEWHVVLSQYVALVIVERMRTPVRHISYGIRHAALSRTYAIVAYVRHNNNAGSPVFGIPGLPHWPESSQFQMKLQYAWNQRTTHPFLWFKTHGCEWLGDINVFVLSKARIGLLTWLNGHGWTNHTTTLFIMAFL